MILQKIIITFFISFLIISCSKDQNKTSAQLKLNFSGITNLVNGIGAGGALLFGKSSTGEQFGKIISADQQDIELPNGDWNFYAVMWDSNPSISSAAGNFSDNVYCGKTAQKLSGVSISISLSLNNSICKDSDFSNGSDYVDVKNKFPNLFIEECDDLDKSNNFTCMRDNQGSAISYRMAFKSYNKTPSGSLAYNGEVMYSVCTATQGALSVFKKGVGLNFPTGRKAMPFVISVEMFLGSPDCGVSTPEVKGMFTHTFENGIATDSSPLNKMVVSPVKNCSSGITDEVSCLNYFGSWNGSVCTLSDATISRFLPAAECIGSTSVNVTSSLKQMLAIPKEFLCNSINFNLTGSDVFSGGNGTSYRPYKICNEWQLNQIGEKFSTISQTNDYKLMNDLDMNKISFEAYPKPYCAEKSGIDSYFNLNPLDRMDCEANGATEVAYSGVFNGNDKIIKNGRITNSSLNRIGFVRSLSGTIKNLNFQNLEVRGSSYVGSLAGSLKAEAKIENIRIIKNEIVGNTFIGGIVGMIESGAAIKNVKIDQGKIRGSDYVGGIVGQNYGSINKALFRGFIVPYNSLGEFAGGIAGYNSGLISEVASEGLLSTMTVHSAGIVAKNLGIVKNCYSTMAIIPLYSAPLFPIKIGGLVAYNYPGSQVNNCYSDTLFKYNGSALPNYAGTVLFNEGIVDYASVYTSINNNAGLAPSASYDSIRRDNAPPFVSLTAPSLWKFTADSLPRLVWEAGDRQCLKTGNLLSVVSQKALGRGSNAANPIYICNIEQFSQMADGAASIFYKMGDDINLSKWSQSNLITEFKGILDGDNHGLNGLNILMNDDSSNTPLTKFGIIKLNTGIIKNIFLVSNVMTVLDPDYSDIGVLVGKNNGLISEIEAYGTYIHGSRNLGGIVGVNTSTGVMTGIRSNQSVLVGEYGIGGLVGYNQGIISKSSASVNISNGSYENYQRIGGIAGYNNKIIDQTKVSGTFIFNLASVNETHALGGLVGYNYDVGVISNSYTDKSTSMTVGGISGIGGAVGVMDGGGAQLKTTFSLTKIYSTQSELDLAVPGKLDQIADNNDERNIGPLVGLVLNSSLISNSFYIKNALLVSPRVVQILSCGPPIIVSNESSLAFNGVIYLPNFLAPTDYSFTNLNEFMSAEPMTCLKNNNLSLSRTFGNYQEHGQVLSSANFRQIGLFSAAGFSIAGEDSPAVIDYYLAIMNKTNLPATTPIWEFAAGDRHPELLQLESR